MPVSVGTCALLANDPDAIMVKEETKYSIHRYGNGGAVSTHISCVLVATQVEEGCTGSVTRQKS